MALTFDSLATVKRTIAAYFRSSVPGWSLSPRAFLGQLNAAVTLSVYLFLKTARQIDLDAVPTSDTSTEGLDAWGEGIGVPTALDGQYGRKDATEALGLTATFTGVPATVYPAGTTYTAADGQTQFENPSNVTIPGSGTIDATINAITAGTAGNLDAGDVLTVDTVPGGGDPTIEITVGPSTEGDDEEENADFLARIRDRLRNPPKALTASDLRQAAEGVDGVERAYIYPRRNGTGTWDIIATGPGTGTARVTNITSDILDAIEEAIDRNVTVEGARYMEPDAAVAGLTLIVRITPTPTVEDQYDFDWDSTGGTWTVDTYPVAADPLKLKLNTLADQTLKDAIDAGDTPRIQIRTTGVVLPVELRCTAYVDGGGKTTLTLEEAPDTAPTVGDDVYAGGGAVASVAQALLDLVDGLGPSKDSGYADEVTDNWDDTLRIDQMRRVVLTTEDTDGTRMVLAFVADPTIDGVSTDYQAEDTLTDAPELLFCKWISVKP